MKNKNTFLLISSQLFSVLGTTLIQFLISLYVLDLTKSPGLFSISLASSMIGRLVSLPFCGVIIDRLSKKKLMILMDCAYFLTTLTFVLVNRYTESVIIICLFVFLLGIISAFETPTSQASLSLLYDEEHIPKMTGITTSIGMLGNLVGPVLAGIIYQFNQLYFLLIICSALFLVAVFCELQLTIPYSKVANDTSILTIIKNDYRETIDYLKQKQIILSICLLAFLLNFIIASFIQVIVPSITRINLGITNQEFGIMNGLFALGGLLGALCYSLFSKKIARHLRLLFNIISISFILLGVTVSLMRSEDLIFLSIVGIIFTVLFLTAMISVHLLSSIQLMIEKEYVGRIISLILILSTLATPLGQLLWGIMSQVLVVETFYLAGLFLGGVTMGITFLFKKTLLRI